jgi:hypothetical protein
LARVQKVGEYQKIFDNASAAKFMPSEDLANTFELKLLQIWKTASTHSKVSGTLDGSGIQYAVKLVQKSVAMVSCMESLRVKDILSKLLAAFAY